MHPQIKDAAYAVWLNLTVVEKQELLGELAAETYGAKSGAVDAAADWHDVAIALYQGLTDAEQARYHLSLCRKTVQNKVVITDAGARS